MVEQDNEQQHDTKRRRLACHVPAAAATPTQEQDHVSSPRSEDGREGHYTYTLGDYLTPIYKRPSVLEAIQHLAKIGNGTAQAGMNDSLKTRLEKLTRSHPIMLFMKGNPEAPQCGFSSQAVEILKTENVKFGTFDILSDNEVREGLKKSSNRPTYLKLYCNEELLGGSDIIIAMREGGELKQTSTELSLALTSRLKSLISSASITLFMRGTLVNPKCGLSRKAVEILIKAKVGFKTIDILSDDEVRRGLKVYSNESRYPQLYIKSELIGGPDIIFGMEKSGELEKILID